MGGQSPRACFLVKASLGGTDLFYRVFGGIEEGLRPRSHTYAQSTPRPRYLSALILFLFFSPPFYLFFLGMYVCMYVHGWYIWTIGWRARGMIVSRFVQAFWVYLACLSGLPVIGCWSC